MNDEVAGAFLELERVGFAFPCRILCCRGSRGYLDKDSLVVDEPLHGAPEAGSGQRTSPQ